MKEKTELELAKEAHPPLDARSPVMVAWFKFLEYTKLEEENEKLINTIERQKVMHGVWKTGCKVLGRSKIELEERNRKLIELCRLLAFPAEETDDDYEDQINKTQILWDDLVDQK